MSENLNKKIEALLFANGDPLDLSKIAKICDVSIREIADALPSLKEGYKGSGITIVYSDKEASLSTSPELQEVVDKLHKEEVSKPLGKAGIETLSIILYQGPVSKSQIDYIRGVNSATIIRNLMIRGLIERKESTENRSFVYSSTIDTLRYLGISSVDELPEYENTKEALEKGVEEAKSTQTNVLE